MPFQFILANLLSADDRTVGVLFLDETGETVDFACADFTPYQMQVVGAYLGIYLRKMSEVLTAAELGRPELIHIQKEELHLHAASLPDGYYLVLVQRPPAQVGRARRALRRAAHQLSEELF